MFGNLKSIALALALFQGSAMSVCVNDPVFEWGSVTDSGNPKKNCKQIRNKEERRAAMCLISEVNAACPATCGSCCEDDAAYEFSLKKSDKLKDCVWITKNEKKKEIRFNEYCTKNNTKGKLHTWGNRSVRDACAVSCDFCFTGVKAITLAPTAAPTPVPTATSAPVATVAPTLSGAPSNQPTRPPSPQPSPFPTLKPSKQPSDTPSNNPSNAPSDTPSNQPSDQPSGAPSKMPSDTPSMLPSNVPSDTPSNQPSDQPSGAPSKMPSDSPSMVPSSDPSSVPSKQPSDSPSMVPSSDPSSEPSSNPTTSIKPSASPSSKPSVSQPTPAPTPVPTISPAPTPAPSPVPTAACQDSATFQFDLTSTTTAQSVGCDWLLKHKNDSVDVRRTGQYCQTATIKTNCCISCGGDEVA